MQAQQFINSFLQIVIAVVLPLVILFGRRLISRALGALEQTALARMSAEDRETLHSAIKIGLRIAAARGFTPQGSLNQLKEYGALAAQRYLKSLGVDVEPDYLRDLIEAEAYKQATLEPHVIESAPLITHDTVRRMIVEILKDAQQRQFELEAERATVQPSAAAAGA